MLDGGADPLYIGRRLVRMAVEDIGLADPRALRVALDACETYERLGSPEGELALAEAALYLAVAGNRMRCTKPIMPRATSSRRRHASGAAPHQERAYTAHEESRLRQGRYAHDEEDAFAAGENYFPEGMPAVEWYRPTERGLEAKIRERIEELRRRNAEAVDKHRRWLSRRRSGYTTQVQGLR